MREEINIKIVTIKCDFLACSAGTRLTSELEHPEKLGGGWITMKMSCGLDKDNLVAVTLVDICPGHAKVLAEQELEKEAKQFKQEQDEERAREVKEGMDEAKHFAIVDRIKKTVDKVVERTAND